MVAAALEVRATPDAFWAAASGTGAATAIVATTAVNAETKPAEVLVIVSSPRGCRSRRSRQRERRMQRRHRISARPHIERRRLLDPLPLGRAPVPELLGTKREANGLLLAG